MSAFSAEDARKERRRILIVVYVLTHGHTGMEVSVRRVREVLEAYDDRPEDDFEREWTAKAKKIMDEKTIQ